MQPLRNKVKKLEQQLDALTARQDELETALADPALYDAGEKDRLKQLLADKAQLDGQLAEVEAAWMESAEALEAAED